MHKLDKELRERKRAVMDCDQLRYKLFDMQRRLDEQVYLLENARLLNSGEAGAVCGPGLPGMNSTSDDVHRMMDESSAHFHPKRWRMYHGLRLPERFSKDKRLQYNGTQLSSSIEINLPIFS
ncbi:unnamed protein product [Protopolystoma xenopodis]|uniref:Uncharacterized protein n=1 Tax=Protopolystoma xenopodis TaxID=117903 RepID=A0A448WF80_9PLAT|nr:unnamed protein product [Protopolystoma xenopodis]